MYRVFKNIFVILLLVAFLLPASGVLVFMHHCDALGLTEVTLDGSSSCCSAEGSLFQHRKSEACNIGHVHGNKCSAPVSVEKESCCKDTLIFVKINLDYLTTFQKLFQTSLFSVNIVKEYNLTPSGFSAALSGTVNDTPDPPGNITYLLNSSLRL